MKKQELVKRAAEAAGVNQKDAAAVIDAALAEIMAAASAGEKVQIFGFGSFETKQRLARTTHIPKTGESVEIAAGIVPVFKPGKLFRDAVNRKDETDA